MHREGHFSEQNFCTVLVWGIMLMILTLEEINKDRENSKLEYKQKRTKQHFNRIVLKNLITQGATK